MGSIIVPVLRQQLKANIVDENALAPFGKTERQD